MPTIVTLTGWKEFETKLANMSKILQSKIGGEVEDAARTWAAGAKNDAPKDQGFLAELINSEKTGPMTAEAVSPAEYSAWLEWGTKTKVSVPSDLQAYAEEFRGGGGGAGNAKQMIYAWMNRVGVPLQFQWPTFISIITKGINPHPFFFIQRPIVEKQLTSRVQNILNTEH